MRYSFQTLGNPKLEGQLFMSGPQNQDQVPEQVKQLLDLNKGIQAVVILYDHGVGQRADAYCKIKET